MATLLISTLSPIALSLIFFIGFLYENYNSNGDKFEELKHKYLNYVFYLTYLVLPSTTTVIFQTFVCTDVDPDNEDYDDHDWYLSADMSIHCSGSYYNVYVAYAAVMIVSVIQMWWYMCRTIDNDASVHTNFNWLQHLYISTHLMR